MCHDNHDNVIKWKHFPRYWPFVRGIHPSPHKGQWRGALVFSLICAWINSWLNNREAGDLKRHGVHYDVIVMMQQRRDESHLNQWRALKTLRPSQLPSFCRGYFPMHSLQWKSSNFDQNFTEFLFYLTITQHWIKWMRGGEQAASHYLSQRLPSLMTRICATRPQLCIPVVKG